MYMTLCCGINHKDILLKSMCISNSASPVCLFSGITTTVRTPGFLSVCKTSQKVTSVEWKPSLTKPSVKSYSKSSLYVTQLEIHVVFFNDFCMCWPARKPVQQLNLCLLCQRRFWAEANWSQAARSRVITEAPEHVVRTLLRRGMCT